MERIEVSPIQSNAWCAEHGPTISARWNRELIERLKTLPRKYCDWPECMKPAQLCTDSKSPATIGP